MESPIRVPALLGPTAAGKTALALAIARRLGMEIISCDSRQIYRGMDIGTAKPTAEERGQVRHWMIDIADPDTAFSAHAFAAEAERIIREQHAAGKRCMVVGGTGFYYRSLTQGLGPAVSADLEVRRQYEERARLHGADTIFEELRRVDPESARILHPHDIRRCIRALEVYHSTGRTLSELKDHAFPPRNILFHAQVVTLPRALLYERIDTRVDAMARQGLWQEFQTLVERGFGAASPGMQSVGYRELFGVREGRCPLEQALSTVKQNTRRFAKRQMTWFRHQIDARHVDMTEHTLDDVAGSVEHFLSTPHDHV